jgi:hypothetical protein
MRTYATGDAAPVLASTFASVTEAVYRGVWNIVAVIGLGAWLAGTGALIRRRHRGLGSVAILGGAAALADAALVAAGAFAAAKVALGATGVLASMWGIALGARLIRNPHEWSRE